VSRHLTQALCSIQGFLVGGHLLRVLDDLALDGGIDGDVLGRELDGQRLSVQTRSYIDYTTDYTLQTTHYRLQTPHYRLYAQTTDYTPTLPHRLQTTDYRL
jgi:hypothetical protein